MPRLICKAVALACLMSAPISAGAQTEPENTAGTTIPAFPDTTKGLESLIKDMLKVAKEGDAKAFQPYAMSLQLPDALAWYKSLFGEMLGAQLAAASDRDRAELRLSSWDKLSNWDKEKLTHVTVNLAFDDSCPTTGASAGFPPLFQRRRPVQLYSVYLSNDSEVRAVALDPGRPTDDLSIEGDGLPVGAAYWAYVDGGFRYVGRLRLGEEPLSAYDAKSSLRWIPPEAFFDLLTHRQDPLIPKSVELPRDEKIRVSLLVMMAEDGVPRVLDLLSGPCAFAVPTAEAVRKWRGKPIVENEKVVKAVTVVSVDFKHVH